MSVDLQALTAQLCAIRSAQFPNVHLRMDGNGVTALTGSGGGTVNCQFGAHAWEQFTLEQQSDGTVTIASSAFPNVHLRMDGNGVTATTGSGGGTVNCQFGAYAWERFTLQQQSDGTVAIASAAFANVHLRMDGNGVTAFTGSGGGTVNCQFGVGAWERFVIEPLTP
jgi:phospholipase C